MKDILFMALIKYVSIEKRQKTVLWHRSHMPTMKSVNRQRRVADPTHKPKNVLMPRNEKRQ